MQGTDHRETLPHRPCSTGAAMTRLNGADTDRAQAGLPLSHRFPTGRL